MAPPLAPCMARQAESAMEPACWAARSGAVENDWDIGPWVEGHDGIPAGAAGGGTRPGSTLAVKPMLSIMRAMACAMASAAVCWAVAG